MATQMFEGRGHAAVYQKYRFAPGKELQQTILSYLREKVSGVRPGWRKNPRSGLTVGGSVYLAGSVALVGASWPDGGTEEAFYGFCYAEAVPEWVLGEGMG